MAKKSNPQQADKEQGLATIKQHFGGIVAVIESAWNLREWLGSCC